MNHLNYYYYSQAVPSYPAVTTTNATTNGTTNALSSSSLSSTLQSPFMTTTTVTTTTTTTNQRNDPTSAAATTGVTAGHPPPTTTTTTKLPHLRTVAGKVWTDASLSDWPDNDYRIFVGNLDPMVTDQQLYEHFHTHYQVRIIRDKKKNNTSLGYGFVSLLDPLECAKAIRQQDQSWLGGRPIRIKRSHWKDRELPDKQKLHRNSNNKNKQRR